MHIRLPQISDVVFISLFCNTSNECCLIVFSQLVFTVEQLSLERDVQVFVSGTDMYMYMYVCVLQNRNRSTPLDLKSKELESTLFNKVGTAIASVQESTRLPV